jgi:hypothetical protein
VLGEPFAERTLVKAAPFSAPSVSVPGSISRTATAAFDELDRLVGAAARLERPADDLARAAADRRRMLSVTNAVRLRSR